jgi:hypothetical protein
MFFALSIRRSVMKSLEAIYTVFCDGILYEIAIYFQTFLKRKFLDDLSFNPFCRNNCVTPRRLLPSSMVTPYLDQWGKNSAV